MAVVVLGLSAFVPIAAAPSVSGQEGGGGPPVLADLTVTGEGVTTYPAFGPNVRRFGMRTTADTHGFTVTATTATPTDQLTINGQPATSGRGRTFRNLKPGEMVTVRVANGGGERAYDVVFLPPSFPLFNLTAHQAGIAPGMLFMGFFTGAAYNLVIDNNGVPVFVNRRTQASFDFKPQPGGRYSYLERSGQQTSTGRDIFDAVILNSAMQEIRRRRTAPPLTNTDNHEVLLLPGGHRILMAYEPVEHDGVVREDTVVQEVDAAGNVVLQWTTWGHIPLSDNLSGNLVEYAHGNSVWVDDTDGNLIISLRGVSTIVKVNRHSGRVMWRFGGRRSNFDIDDPLGGPCGQHTASRLPNGNLLVFDNGVDCAPDGHDRSSSRVAEYSLDEANRTAELVWSRDLGIFGFATGSAQRLANGNTLVAWGTAGTISELNADGDVLWETTPRTPGGAVSASYRVQRAPFPDAIVPRVVFTSPANGATILQGQNVRAAYTCVDEGGSSIATCEGSVANGVLLDTDTPGEHTIEVTATDGAGNTRTLERTYEVVPNQPDLMVRREPAGRLVGNNVYNRNGAGQTRNANVRDGGEAVFTVIAENDGTSVDDFVLHGSPHDDRFRVRYFDGDRDVTAAVKAGSYRIRGLAPHARHRIQVRVTGRLVASSGDDIDVFVQARSVADPARRDTVKMAVQRTGGEIERATIHPPPA
jgi:hypothetical protein